MGRMKDIAIELEENMYDEFLSKMLTSETLKEVIDFAKNEIANRLSYRLKSFEDELVPRLTSDWNDHQRQLGEND